MVKRRRSLGPGFAEEIAKVTSKIGHFNKAESPNWVDTFLPNFHPVEEDVSSKSTWRLMFFSIVSLALFFIIFLRLFRLQIVEGKTNRVLANNNRIAIKVIHAPRGVIFDRNGIILAANSPAFRIANANFATQKERYITREQALEWEVKNDSRLSQLEVDNVRTYPEGEEFAHIVGYMGEISQDQYKDAKFKNYRLGDYIGQAGAEAQYEKLLRGKDGGEIIEVDSSGKKLRTLRLEPPVAGQNIYLSIDASLQKKVYEETERTLKKTASCCAAVIAQDPSNGQILSLISFPSFDPNIFSQNKDELAIARVFSDKNSPLLNRVISGTYPPGSTFKIVTSLAALASGIKPDFEVQDEGVMYLGPYKFTNWYFNQYGKVEGPVNMQKALQRSNDTYFYKISQITGSEAIIGWSKKLNLGSKLGIALPAEEKGLVPDDDWKQKNLGVSWYPGDTLHMSIGQGFLLTTPLQVLGMTSYIAANGTIYKPQILLSEKPQTLVSNLLSKDYINLVKGGLEQVPVQGGTAWPFFAFPIKTAGKTGTAEYGDPKNRTHAWYTSYAPVDDPKIVLTVLVEGGGEGSSVASPIAKEVYRWYFSPDKNKLISDIYISASDSSKILGE